MLSKEINIVRVVRKLRLMEEVLGKVVPKSEFKQLKARSKYRESWIKIQGQRSDEDNMGPV